MLAVFERIGIGLVERIIAAAVGEASLEMVTYTNQPSSGGRGTPDAEIHASVRYLIETKTTANAISRDQLRRHLDRLNGSYADERLLVITPDPEEPQSIADLGDQRAVWIGFALLVQAIEELSLDPDELVSEQQRFLLRELAMFFESEGLLAVDDTVVVAARDAYPEYLKISAYACQPNRPIRRVSHIGFYTDKQVMPEISRVRHKFTAVQFTPEQVVILSKSSDPLDARLGEVIAWRLETRSTQLGESFDVYILSGPSDPETVLLSSPLVHDARGAWTQKQRYTSVARLKNANTTADL